MFQGVVFYLAIFPLMTSAAGTILPLPSSSGSVSIPSVSPINAFRQLFLKHEYSPQARITCAATTLSVSTLVADRPQFSRRTIGTTRILKSQNGKIRVQSDRLVWLSYHGKEFKNEWSDEDVLDQLLPLLDDLEVEESRVPIAVIIGVVR